MAYGRRRDGACPATAGNPAPHRCAGAGRLRPSLVPRRCRARAQMPDPLLATDQDFGRPDHSRAGRRERRGRPAGMHRLAGRPASGHNPPAAGQLHPARAADHRTRQQRAHHRRRQTSDHQSSRNRRVYRRRGPRARRQRGHRQGPQSLLAARRVHDPRRGDLGAHPPAAVGGEQRLRDSQPRVRHPRHGRARPDRRRMRIHSPIARHRQPPGGRHHRRHRPPGPAGHPLRILPLGGPRACPRSVGRPQPRQRDDAALPDPHRLPPASRRGRGRHHEHPRRDQERRHVHPPQPARRPVRGQRLRRRDRPHPDAQPARRGHRHRQHSTGLATPASGWCPTPRSAR